MEELFVKFWHVLLAALAAVVFIVRQEGRTNFHAEELRRLQKQRDADLEAAMKSREETHSMLRDISAKLDRLVERLMVKGHGE